MTGHTVKSHRLPNALWDRISGYRHASRCKTEIEAVTRLIEAGLVVNGMGAGEQFEKARNAGSDLAAERWSELLRINREVLPRILKDMPN